MVTGEERAIVNCSNCGTANKLPVGYQAPIYNQPVHRRCDDCNGRLIYEGEDDGKARLSCPMCDPKRESI
jgi:DNA-directed RNA polymerase subunit M/transcription elongation factor TFIIS